MQDDPVKLTVLVDKDVAEELNELIPWGLRRHLISSALRLITSAIRNDGGMMLGAIISGDIKLILDLDEKEDKNAKT